MLTRHSVVTESPSHVDTIPINLVATEDGRTLLAVTGKSLTIKLEMLATNTYSNCKLCRT